MRQHCLKLSHFYCYRLLTSKPPLRCPLLMTYEMLPCCRCLNVLSQTFSSTQQSLKPAKKCYNYLSMEALTWSLRPNIVFNEKRLRKWRFPSLTLTVMADDVTWLLPLRCPHTSHTHTSLSHTHTSLTHIRTSHTHSHTHTHTHTADNWVLVIVHLMSFSPCFGNLCLYLNRRPLRLYFPKCWWLIQFKRTAGIVHISSQINMSKTHFLWETHCGKVTF